MLGYDNLGYAPEVVMVVVLVNLVILRTVDEAYYVGILLDGTRLAQVTQLRTLALIPLAALHAAVQL